MTSRGSEARSDIKLIWTLLDSHTKKRFLQLACALASINLLDLIGIFFFASFASGVFNLVEENNRKTRFEIFLSDRFLVDFNGVQLLVVMAVAMIFSFVFKSTLSAFINQRTLFFLAKREFYFATLVLKKYRKNNADTFYGKSPEEINYACGISISRIFNGVLFPLSQLLNDAALLFLVFLVLLYTSPSSTLLISTIVVVFITLISRKINIATANTSKLLVDSHVVTQESIREFYEGYREIVTKDYANFNEEKFNKSRKQQATLQARLLWLQQIPRFSLEIVILISSALLSTFEFILNDTRTALIKLSVFIVTIFRILPSIQRMQTSTLSINSGLVAAQPALNILLQKTGQSFELKDNDIAHSSKSLKVTAIEFLDVSYKYLGSPMYAFDSIYSEIKTSQIVGLTGESGIGKSTLVDCMIGLRSLSRGSIIYRDEAKQSVRPVLAYVPQKPFIVNADLRTNISLQTNLSMNKELEMKSLFNFFFREIVEEEADISLTLESNLTSSSNSISGGQAQRIAIMRALLSHADIYFLDECLSGLSESMTRKIISFLKQNYPEQVFLLISHSISLLKLCDKAYKMSRNKLVEFSS